MSASSSGVVKMLAAQSCRVPAGRYWQTVRRVARVRQQADQARAVRQQLGRRDRRVPGAPRRHRGDRRVDVEEAVVLEAQQHARGDHLARRRDERDPIGTEVAPVLLVDHAVVAVDHDQPGAVETVLVDEALDDRPDRREVVRRGGGGRRGRGGGRGRCRRPRRRGRARRRRRGGGLGLARRRGRLDTAVAGIMSTPVVAGPASSSLQAASPTRARAAASVIARRRRDACISGLLSTPVPPPSCRPRGSRSTWLGFGTVSGAHHQWGWACGLRSSRSMTAAVLCGIDGADRGRRAAMTMTTVARRWRRDGDDDGRAGGGDHRHRGQGADDAEVRPGRRWQGAPRVRPHHDQRAVRRLSPSHRSPSATATGSCCAGQRRAGGHHVGASTARPRASRSNPRLPSSASSTSSCRPTRTRTSPSP